MLPDHLFISFGWSSKHHHENPGRSMRSIAKELQVSECTIRTVVHQDIWYKSYVMRKRQFISAKTQENCLMRSKRLLNKVKNPHEHGMLWFFSEEKALTKIRKQTDGMTGGYVHLLLKYPGGRTPNIRLLWWFRSCEQWRSCHATLHFPTRS